MIKFVGREQDLSVIQAFVGNSAAHGGTLLLSGEPGVGKSALLDAAGQMAVSGGIQVLRAVGAEFEDVRYSCLNQLLLPLRADLDRLNDLQRSALSVALGHSTGPASDRLIVWDAALMLLRLASAGRPLLLLADNLQWIDKFSAEVLGFAARRLAGSRIGILAAKRQGTSPVFDPDAPTHEVTPLDDDSSLQLVTARFPDLVPAVRDRVMAEARGNPLALVELPAALTRVQRSALAALPEMLPLGERLLARYSPQIAALPTTVRYLLLLAALEGTGDLGLLRAVAGDGAIDDLAPAEHAGLVRANDATGTMTFSHPLIGSTVIELSPAGEVRRAHRALAAVHLDGQPGRRVWHLAGAAIGPDQDVADSLDTLARQLQDQGDASRAVAVLVRAAQLSHHDGDRGRRLAEAASLSGAVTGDLSLVPGLLASARCYPLGPEASLHAAVADACIRLNRTDDIETVHGSIADAIQARLASSTSSGTALPVAWHTLLTVCAAMARPGPGEPLGAAPAARAPSHWRTLTVAIAAARADRLPGCRDALSRIVRDGHENGAMVPAITALGWLSLDAFLAGAWDRAGRQAEECLRLCRVYSQPGRAWVAREQMAMIAAARGEDELVQTLTRQVLQWAMPRGVSAACHGAHRALALAALGRGDFEEAYREAVAVSAPGRLDRHAPHALWGAMDLVEAAVRTGHQREAETHVAAIREADIARISPRLALLATASRALTAPAGQAGQLFDQALGIAGADRWPFEFARVQLAFGEHLRRTRAASDARIHLGAAIGTFGVLGARPWADRATSELRATRLTVTRSEHHWTEELTAQERQIASLAAAGLTNKQIAQRLYLSPRTVGNHLYRTFPKLGIATRAGLRDALAALGVEHTAAQVS